MSRLTLEDFERASKCPALNQRVPACQEISGSVAHALWEATLANHQAWPKEKIFMAALGIALTLSRGSNETDTKRIHSSTNTELEKQASTPAKLGTEQEWPALVQQLATG